MAKKRTTTSKKEKTTDVLPDVDVKLTVNTPPEWGLEDEWDDDGGFAEAYKETVGKAYAIKRKTGVRIVTKAEAQQEYLRIPNFLMQEALGSIGVASRTWIEILGPEGSGKSTMMFTIAGYWIRQYRCPFLLMETENKPFTKERALRTMHTNARIATKMLNHVVEHSVHTLGDFYEQLITGLKSIRTSGVVPASVPIIVGIDSLSKLMPDSHAVGLEVSKDAKKDKSDSAGDKAVEVGGGQTMSAAKWWADFARRLPEITETFNAVFIAVRHQNDQVLMTFGAKPTSALKNDTSFGGRGTKQNASLRIILQKGSDKKIGENIVGREILARIEKNSYGKDNTKFSYDLLTEPERFDYQGYLAPALRFSEAFAASMAKSKTWPDVSVSMKRVTSKDLGLESVDLDDFFAFIHADPGILARLGKDRYITGYYSLIEEIKAAQEELNDVTTKSSKAVDDSPDEGDEDTELGEGELE